MRFVKIDGRAVSTLRNRLGITQQELAARVGCSLSSVQFWEAGRSSPRGYRLRRLIELCPDAETRSLFLPAAPTGSASPGSPEVAGASTQADAGRSLLDAEFLRTLPAETRALYQDTVRNVLELTAMKMQGNQVAAEGLRFLAETIIQIVGMASEPRPVTGRGTNFPSQMVERPKAEGE